MIFAEIILFSPLDTDWGSLFSDNAIDILIHIDIFCIRQIIRGDFGTRVNHWVSPTGLRHGCQDIFGSYDS